MFSYSVYLISYLITQLFMEPSVIELYQETNELHM
jgi:hypothetical protein